MIEDKGLRRWDTALLLSWVRAFCSHTVVTDQKEPVRDNSPSVLRQEDTNLIPILLANAFSYLSLADDRNHLETPHRMAQLRQ